MILHRAKKRSYEHLNLNWKGLKRLQPLLLDHGSHFEILYTYICYYFHLFLLSVGNRLLSNWVDVKKVIRSYHLAAFCNYETAKSIDRKNCVYRFGNFQSKDNAHDMASVVGIVRHPATTSNRKQSYRFPRFHCKWRPPEKGLKRLQRCWKVVL